MGQDFRTVEQQLQRTSDQFSILGKSLTEKDTRIQEATQQITSLHQVIADKDAGLAGKDSRILEAEQQIAAKDTRILEAEQQIAAKDLRILEVEQQIAGLHTLITAKDTRILEAEQQIAGLHTLIAAKDREILEQDQKILFSEQYIASLLSQVKETNAGIVARDLEIAGIKDSITYQCTAKFHKNVIEVLFPRNSGQREVYDLGLKSGRILINDGFRKLVWSYHERNRTRKREKELRERSDENTIPVSAVRRDEVTGVPAITLPEPQPDVEISVIIPVHNKVRYTLSCLASLAQKTTGTSYEVIVVDDASTDDTAEQLRHIGNLTIIRNPRNLGFVDSCNRGAEAASGKFLFFLNNDTEVTENWALPLLDLIKKEDVGAVGVKLVYPDGTLQEAGGIIWNDASGWNYGRMDNADKPEYNFIRDVDYCSGAALLVKRDLFTTLKGFDLRFRPGYYEDTDVCFAIRNLGYRVLYQPRSCITHHEGITSGTDLSAGMKQYQEINKQKFLEKWKDTLQADHFSPDPKNVMKARSRKEGRSILVIDHYVPTYDRDSGSCRMFNILKILAELHKNVTFISENLLKIEPYTTVMQQKGIEVLYCPFIQTIEFHLLEKGQTYDIVVLSRAHIAIKYIDLIRKYCPHAKIIFDTVDLQFLRLSRQAGVENNPAVLKEADSIRKTELGLARMVHSTWVVSAVEQELLLKEEPSLHVDVVSNIHDIHRGNKPFQERQDLLFIGGFAHPPNVDAMKWFVSAIFPGLNQRYPE